MIAEYVYYIKNDAKKAIADLVESLKINPHNYFSFRALMEIYIRTNMTLEKEQLFEQYGELYEEE